MADVDSDVDHLQDEHNNNQTDLDESTSSNGPLPASNVPSDVDWTQANNSSASDHSSGEGGEDKESKKQAKKLRYKSAPFLDLENHDALRAFILDHHDPWKAAIDLMELVNIQKYSIDQVGVVTEVVTPCLRERIPDPSIVTTEQQLAVFEAYISCRIACFEFYDELFLLSQFEDKVLLGEFLLEQIKNASQCNTAEKILKIFIHCKVNNVNLILTSLLITFFKFDGSARVIESFLNSCDKTITTDFLKTLDRMLISQNEVRDFLTDHEIECKKDSPFKDIKKFFSRIYKSNGRYDLHKDAPHMFASITPTYLEVSNWDTCLYLLRCKYKSNNKTPMSDEAWLELSHLLVQSTPNIKNRVMNTLRNINADELERWNRRLRYPEQYVVQPLVNNEFTYVPGSRAGCSNPTQQYRYYTGRPLRSILIKFVEDVADFEGMLVYLKNQNVIGLDGEWLPIFSFMPTRISILQVSTISHCFILDLLNFYQKPPQYRACWTRLVKEIFENDKIVKIGFGIHHDLDNLRAATGERVGLVNTLDLSKHSAQLITYFGEQNLRAYVDGPNQSAVKRCLMNIIMRCREREFRQQGLSQLTYVLFGKELDKSEQMSNWNRRPLRREQYIYAALDAFCLVDIFETLMMLNNQLLHFESVQAFLQAVKTFCSDGGGVAPNPCGSRPGGEVDDEVGEGGGEGDPEVVPEEKPKLNSSTSRGNRNRKNNRRNRKNNAAAASGGGGGTFAPPRVFDRNQFE